VRADGQKVYVAQQVGQVSRLAVLNALPGLAPATQIPLGSQETAPNGVAVVNAAGQVAVALRDVASAAVVNPETGGFVTTIPANWLPLGVVVHDGYGYVANFGNNTITVFDPVTLAPTNTLFVGQQPSHFARTGGADLFATMNGNGEIVRLRDGQIAGHWYGLVAPYGIAYELATDRLYVANRGSAQTVTVLNGLTGQTLAAIAIGQEPYALGVNDNTGHLFVACGDRVKAYRTGDLALIATIPVPPGAEEGIAVDPIADRVYVTSRSGHAVSVIQDVAGPAVTTGFNRWLELWLRSVLGL
jgi:YVTN family beta-propeller protein